MDGITNTEATPEREKEEEKRENAAKQQTEEEEKQSVNSAEEGDDDQDRPSAKPQTPHRQRGGSIRARSGSTADQKAQNHEMSKQSEKVQQEQNVHNAITHFFHDLHGLIEGEMQMGFNELQLLEQMNQMVEKKYGNMNGKAVALREQINKMRQQYEQCQPFFEQIEQIDETVTELANVAKYLDQYTRNLELQLKQYL